MTLNCLKTFTLILTTTLTLICGAILYNLTLLTSTINICTEKTNIDFMKLTTNIPCIQPRINNLPKKP